MLFVIMSNNENPFFYAFSDFFDNLYAYRHGELIIIKSCLAHTN